MSVAPPVPIHDWTRVPPGIWHDFHVAWIGEVRKQLNGGLLPDPFYALAEPQGGFAVEADPPDGPESPEEEDGGDRRFEGDLLSLHGGGVSRTAAGWRWPRRRRGCDSDFRPGRGRWPGGSRSGTRPATGSWP